jgi:hypothetical protein
MMLTMRREREGDVTSVRWDIDRYHELQERAFDALGAEQHHLATGDADRPVARRLRKQDRGDAGVVLGGARGGVAIAVSQEPNIATPLPSRVTGVDEQVRPWKLARRQRVPGTPHRLVVLGQSRRDQARETHLRGVPRSSRMSRARTRSARTCRHLGGDNTR